MLAGSPLSPNAASKSALPEIDAQCALFDQEAQDLLAEERIALGALRHLPDQRVGQGVDAEPRLREMPDVACGKRLERKRPHAGTAAPAGDVFGSPRLDDEQVRLCADLDQFAEQLFRCAVDPVNVFKHQNHRGGAAFRLQQGRQQVARAQADQDAVESRQRSFRRFETQQIEQEAQILCRMQIQPAKARLELSRNFGRFVLRSDPESAAHDLEERQKRNLLTVARAVSREDKGFFGSQALQKLKHEACLAQTRLGDEVDHAKPVSRPAERVAQRRQFLIATDIRTEAPAKRGVESPGPLVNGHEPPEFLRFGLALDRVLSVEAHVDEPFDEASRRFADQAASRWRQGLKA